MADAAVPGPLNPVAKTKKKGKGKTMLVGVVLLLLVAGGGGAAYWYFMMRGEAAPAPEQPVEQKAASGIVSFEPFLVNLADDGGHAYLRVTLKLLVTDEEEAKLFDETPVIKSVIRSTILETLATQSATTLVTPEGKAALKETISKRIAALKQPIEVHDVLFADFVVQY
jgi:flagellar FliL protein